MALLESRPRAVYRRLPERTGETAPIGTETPVECSVGMMAYNEEASIADAIGSMLGQRLERSHIAELIVVASGCEDQTAAIVASLARQDRRIRLIEQARREGKASAVNLFIGAARSEVLVMVGADVLVREDTFDALLPHFNDPAVGMVGGHPTPVNDQATFLGHAVHLQWRLHDRVARQSPKLGEIVAFRNVIPSIPFDTPVDEISIQALVSQLGYQLVYEPRAIVYNRGPTTVRDFLRQRRRIYAGHLRIRDQQGYAACTMSTGRIARALWRSGSASSPRAMLWTAGTVGLEATARALGRYDVIRRRPQHVWQVCETTKRYIAEGVNGASQQNVAVFHIVDFHRWQLEVGVHTSCHLTRRIAEHIKRSLGSKAIVSIQQSGTIMAVLPGDREAAERTAQHLVEEVEASPPSLGGRETTAAVRLACGIIAFPPAGRPLARLLATPILDADPARLMAG